jgi:hypothetical protein
LLAQPAAFTCSVSRIVFTSAMVGILQGMRLAPEISWLQQFGNEQLAIGNWPK